MTFRQNVKKYGQILLGFETLWMLFYMGVSIAAFAISTDDFFMVPGSMAYGQDGLIRNTLTAFRSHVLVSGSLATLVAFNWDRPSHFGIIFFLFLLYFDTSNLVDICWFSKIRSYAVTQHLWHAAIALAVFQVLLTVNASIFYGLYSWGGIKQQQLPKSSMLTRQQQQSLYKKL